MTENTDRTAVEDVTEEELTEAELDTISLFVSMLASAGIQADIVAAYARVHGDSQAAATSIGGAIKDVGDMCELRRGGDGTFVKTPEDVVLDGRSFALVVEYAGQIDRPDDFVPGAELVAKVLRMYYAGVRRCLAAMKD